MFCKSVVTMNVIFGDIWLQGLIGVIAFSALIYFLWTENYNYWKIRNVPFLEPTFPFGNTKELLSPISYKFNGHVFGNFYFQLKGHKYGGIINVRKPTLILRDPDIIKTILTKDFNYFMDRGMTFDEKADPLSAHLFNLSGEKWRKLRSKLTPTFTSGKMKVMFHLMNACGKKLEKSLRQHAEKEDTIEIKDFMERFGTDIVGSCAFGLDIDSINNPENEFRRISNNIFVQDRTKIFRTILNLLIPGLSYVLKMKANPKEREEFFFKIVRETIEYREKNNINRNDFLELLIQMNKGKLDDEPNDSPKKSYLEENLKKNPKKSDEIYLTNELMTAQCFVFFIAGFDTSSSILSFCLYELALNKTLQRRAQDEIAKILSKHGGEISYEALKEMTYMDQVIQETLRKYPPVANILRECVADYVLKESNIIIEKGVKITVPLFGLHRDPEYYPEPECFDPERFSEKEKKLRHPYAYLPFGEGPRGCIGYRFAIMQIKTGLVKVLSNYELHRTPETQVPLEINNKSVIAKPKYGIKIKITKRIK